MTEEFDVTKEEESGSNEKKKEEETGNEKGRQTMLVYFPSTVEVSNS